MAFLLHSYKPLTKEYTIMINKEEILELASIHKPLCVSIFIPTHRAGLETLDGTDKIALKNQIKHVRQQLENAHKSQEEIKAFLKPAVQLLENTEFWREQSDGLALFLTKEDFFKFSLPIRFNEFSYVSQEFYLKPIMPLFGEPATFYLLKLQMEEVKLFECSKHTIQEIIINDLVPSQLEDRVGYDYKEKGIQFRTGQGNGGNGTFHGHEDLSTEKKEELSRFFSAVDKGIHSVVHDDQNIPLLVACHDFHFPIFKNVSNYYSLHDQHISGDLHNSNVFLIHEKACEILKPYFDQDQQEKLKMLEDSLHTGKASLNLDEIIPAAVDGKIDTLFISPDFEIYGVYNQEEREVKKRDKKDSASVALLNLAAINVLEKGGEVYLLDEENLPEEMKGVGALYRYDINQ